MEDYTMTARLLQSDRQVSRTEIKKIESTITDIQDPTTRANFEKPLSVLTRSTVADPDDTTIGVFGVTGHGKSSLLNAIFHSIRLPTSDSNACTPVPIIIRYMEGEGSKVTVIYRTEPEFNAERKALIEHLFASKEFGYSEEITLNEDRAKSKLNALYPKLNIDEFRTTSDELEVELDKLDDRYGINQCIGKGSQEFVCHDADDFAKVTQKFGASAELENEEAAVLWPIIKEMHVGVQADILKQGLVMVDIPGTMDAEAARAEVAKQWTTKCTSRFILASCDRAVDSPDVWDHVGDILWRDRMTGTNSKITIVLSQIDKGTKDESERHVANDAAYASLRSKSVELDQELSRLKIREIVLEAAMRQIQSASGACSQILMSMLTGQLVSVPEPSWWSRIHVSGWAEGPLISFEPSDNTDIVSSTVITQDQAVGMMQRLSDSSKNTASIPKSPEVARQAQELQKEMRRRRTSAKVAAIRSKMIEKIATKMAEQASTLSQDRGDENFASDDMQPAAFRDLAEKTTMVIGVCPPAAAAVRARAAGQVADARYGDWLDLESTGIPSIERLMNSLCLYRQMSHEMGCLRQIRDGLLDIQIMSSANQDLLKGEWWASVGQKLCTDTAESIRDTIQSCTTDIEKSMEEINDPAFRKGTEDTISGVRKPIKSSTNSSDLEYIVKPLKAMVEYLLEMHPSTKRATLYRRGQYTQRKKGGSIRSIDVNAHLGRQLQKVIEGFLERDLRKAIYLNRNKLIKNIRDLLSGIHEEVVRQCTSPDASNNQTLRQCLEVNQREQERCAHLIEETSKVLIEEIIQIPQTVVLTEVKKFMEPVYLEIRRVCDDRKAARKRGDKLSSGFTNTLEDIFKSFVVNGARSMLDQATKGVETAELTAIAETFGTAFSEDGKNVFRRATSKLLATYTEAFQGGRQKKNTSLADLSKMKVLHAKATKEMARLDGIIQQAQDTVPGLKREAESDLNSARKRVHRECSADHGTLMQPIEVE